MMSYRIRKKTRTFIWYFLSVTIVASFYLACSYTTSKFTSTTETQNKHSILFHPDEMINFQNKPKDCNKKELNLKDDIIPLFMYNVIDSIIKQNKLTFSDCKLSKPKNNFVYIKNHKCASDTLTTTFRIYAYKRNLSVVLATKGHDLLGWPHAFMPYMHRVKRSQEYNILLDHIVYNHSYLSTIMPKNTVYFSSLREPAGRLLSAVVYFGVGTCALMPDETRMSDYLTNRIAATNAFLSNMDYYDQNYLSVENLFSKEKCKCIPNGVSVLKNAMAFDLGFPVGYHVGTIDQSQNYVYIIKWLQDLYKQMPLVVLFEYFDESMILLKRYMCWDMKDIMYKHLNSWKNPKPQFDINKIEAFRNWTNVDTLLYDLYNKSFWVNVKKLGDDFQQEVQVYKQQLKTVTKFCAVNQDDKFKENSLVIDKSRWNSPYTITQVDCALLHDPYNLRDHLKHRYDSSPPLSSEPVYKENGYFWC